MDYDELKAGPDLDKLVAERVMGWHLVDINTGDVPYWVWFDSNSHLQTEAVLWKPSEWISCAWQVVEKWIKDFDIPGHDPFILMCNPKGLWECSFNVEWTWEGPEMLDTIVRADTAPLAICRAALKAVHV